MPNAYCCKQIPNQKQHFWDTRSYQFCFKECVQKEGKWLCPEHKEDCL